MLSDSSGTKPGLPVDAVAGDEPGNKVGAPGTPTVAAELKLSYVGRAIVVL